MQKMDRKQLEPAVQPHAVSTRTDLGPVPDLDLGRYKPYLEDSDLSDAEKAEFLSALWSIMVGFVDLGFGVDSVQRLFPEIFENAPEAHEDTLESRQNTLTNQFSRGNSAPE